MQMRRLLAALVVVGLSACGGSGSTPAPSASPAPLSTTSAVATGAVATSQVSPTPNATPPGPIERGGLLFSWYGGAGPNDKVAYVMSRDGSNQRRILSNVVGDIRALGWRPDGDLMTFVVRDSAHPDGAIWSAAADGTGAALLYDGLADGCTSVFHPVWSPDGTRLSIVCYVDRDTTHDSILGIYDLSKRQLTKLVTYSWPDFLDDPARWSHDGTRIAYPVLHWDPTNTFLDGSRIAAIKADGASKPRDLNDNATFASTPAWSPDDSLLLYNTYDFGNMGGATVSDLYSMRPDGSDVQSFLTAAAAGVARIGHPEWDPSGTRIWVGVRVGADTYRIAWLDPSTKALTMLPTIAAGAEVRP
jgi:Tol biopolymer transport system component